jgi:hypothetical protein
VARLLDGGLISSGRSADQADSNTGCRDRAARGVLPAADAAQEGDSRPEDRVVTEIERFPQDLQDGRSSMESLAQKVTDPLFCFLEGEFRHHVGLRCDEMMKRNAAVRGGGTVTRCPAAG